MQETKKLKFILIALLTTIIIILVVVLVASKISKSNTVSSGDKASFKDSVKMLIETINQKKLEDSNFDSTLINNDNVESILNISSENYSNITIVERRSSPYISIVGSGEWDGLVACGTYDNLKIMESKSGECNEDLIPPIIKITGNSSINVPAGVEYIDAGATALDDVDGDVTSKIITDSNVNYKVSGTYTITYSVEDSAGNIATVIRTVKVIDNTSPTIIFGTNGSSKYTKITNTTVTVKDAYGNVDLSSLKYVWNTSVTTPTESSFSTTFTNNQTLNTPSNVTGNYYLWVLAKDNSGNKTITRTNAFNLDNIKPVISLLGNNNITLNFGEAYIEYGATSVDNIDRSVAVIPSGTVNVNKIGTYTITYNAIDSSGNIATPLTRTVTVVDNIAPTVVFGTNENSTYAKSRSTIVAVSDTHSNVDLSSLKYLWNTSTNIPLESSFITSFNNGEAIKTPSNVTGSYYLWILAKDISGNTTITRTNIFNLDNEAPVITLTGSDNINIYCGDQYIDLGATAIDNIDGVTSITAIGTVNPMIIGTYTVTYTATDLSDNTASLSRTVNVLDNIKGVNKPQLVSGLIPVKWSNGSWVTTTSSDDDWYNYTTSDKKWANAITADGSMWVWIPRYIYKISTGWHTATVGTIDIQFSKGIDDNWNSSSIGNIDTDQTSNASNNKWTNHPAFTFGSTELTGIWIAKFEATAAEGVANGYTSDNLCPVEGDNITTKTVKILPNIQSWRCIQTGNIFTVSRNMETNAIYGWGTSGNDIDTHLMKNTEWGAIAYLTQSVYGKNAEVWINNSSTYIIGCTGASTSAASYAGCENTYDTANGMQASTTGNIYGIYDMAGGSWELVSAYLNNGNINLNSGLSIINADSKYKNMYTVGAIDDRTSNYALTIDFKGDAIYETSSTPSASTSWFSDYSNMPSFSSMWFMRGGYWYEGSGAGTFSFRYTHGGLFSHIGFRPVLAVNTGL